VPSLYGEILSDPIFLGQLKDRFQQFDQGGWSVEDVQLIDLGGNGLTVEIDAVRFAAEPAKRDAERKVRSTTSGGLPRDMPYRGPLRLPRPS
jgi:hypothetical protein